MQNIELKTFDQFVYKCQHSRSQNAEINIEVYRKTPRLVAKLQPFTPCIPSVYPGNGSRHAVDTKIQESNTKIILQYLIESNCENEKRSLEKKPEEWLLYLQDLIEKQNKNCDYRIKCTY